MEDHQLESLEREVKAHRERIAQLVESIRDIEDNLALVVGAPEKVAREAERLRMELKGRRAAFAVGSAHLRSFKAS
jgi:predicted  nucleic acid-binding Zn-ribbon protein